MDSIARRSAQAKAGPARDAAGVWRTWRPSAAEGAAAASEAVAARMKAGRPQPHVDQSGLAKAISLPARRFDSRGHRKKRRPRSGGQTPALRIECIALKINPSRKTTAVTRKTPCTNLRLDSDAPARPKRWRLLRAAPAVCRRRSLTMRGGSARLFSGRKGPGGCLAATAAKGLCKKETVISPPCEHRHTHGPRGTSYPLSGFSGPTRERCLRVAVISWARELKLCLWTRAQNRLYLNVYPSPSRAVPQCPSRHQPASTRLGHHQCLI